MVTWHGPPTIPSQNLKDPMTMARGRGMEPGDPPRGVTGIFGMGVIDFGDIDDSGKNKICEHTYEII